MGENPSSPLNREAELKLLLKVYSIITDKRNYIYYKVLFG